MTSAQKKGPKSRIEISESAIANANSSPERVKRYVQLMATDRKTGVPYPLGSHRDAQKPTSRERNCLVCLVHEVLVRAPSHLATASATRVRFDSDGIRAGD